MRESSIPMLRQYVENWRRAGAELARLRELELTNADTQGAVRILFGDNTLVQDSPRLTDSGLVEQQRWFARMREISSAR